MCAYNTNITSASTGPGEPASPIWIRNPCYFLVAHAFCTEQNVASEEAMKRSRYSGKKKIENESKIIIRQEQQQKHKKVAQRKIRACCVSKVSETEEEKNRKTHVHSFVLHLPLRPPISHNLLHSLSHSLSHVRLLHYPTVNMHCGSVAHTAASRAECVYSMPTIVNNHVPP